MEGKCRSPRLTQEEPAGRAGGLRLSLVLGVGYGTAKVQPQALPELKPSANTGTTIQPSSR